MKIALAASLWLLSYSISYSQADSLALRYAALISQEELHRHLAVLSSDEYEGRDTGKEGQKKAAAYLREQFISFGIPAVPAEDPDMIVDGYYQPFELIEERSGSISIVSKGTTYSFMKELVYFNEFISSDRTVDQVLFMGDGRSMTGIEEGNNILLVDDGVGTMVEFMGWLQSRAELARSSGAALVLVSTPRTEELTTELGHFITGSRMRLADGEARMPKTGMQTILVDKAVMSQMLTVKRPVRMERLKQGKKIPVELTIRHTPMRNEVITENVLAFIEGTDKKDEIVIITAHYDHIGVEDGEVYNGADDDGSGTVAMIGIAQAFAQAKAEGNGPRRSILVMPVSAEEKGLLGSRYYSEHPVFPLENSVANLNIDMIGRTDSTHVGGAPYIYIIGSDRLSTELHEINEEANTTYVGLELDYTFNAEDDPNKFYYRSDHYNFARKGVPAIFYFSGVHEDYHQPSDTIEKIEFDKLHQRTMLVFHTAWILANREERIVVDKPSKP